MRTLCCVELIFFFFFQAEDGILDHCVTGVQTCALPIFDLAREVQPRARSRGCTSRARSTAPPATRKPRLRGSSREIGRASCRERGEIADGGVATVYKTHMTG